MTNPILHALVLAEAIIIPGGLIVYFAWKIRNRCKESKAIAAEDRRKDPIAEIRNAFLSQFPKESLRAKSRREQLGRARRRKRFNPKKSPK